MKKSDEEEKKQRNCLKIPSIVTFGVLMCSITDIQNGGWETEGFDLMFPDSGYIPRLRSVHEGFCPWRLFRVLNEMYPILSTNLTHLFLLKNRCASGDRE